MTRTIDLGLVGTDQPKVNGAAPAGRWRHPSRALRPTGRWAAGRGPGWWPAAALAAVLVLTGATAPPAEHPAPTLVPLVTVPAGHATFAGNHLYVHRSDRPAGDGGTITAYRLTDGGRAWQRRLPSAVALTVPAGVPIVISANDDVPTPGAATSREATITSTALAPATGAPLWTRAGGPAGEVAGGVLFYDRAARAGGDRYLLTAVDPHNGRQVWRVPVRGRLDWDRDRLASLSVDGVLTTYDLATGTRLASTRVGQATAGSTGSAGPGRPGGGASLQPSLVMLGSLVALVDHLAGDLAAYDADTLAHEWTTAVPGTDHLRRCDRLICQVSSGHVHALDPATGREAWPPVRADPSSDRVPVNLPGGGYLLLGETSVGSSSLVVEVATGRPVRELTGWTVSRRDSRDGTGATAPAPLLFRFDRQAHVTWVGRLDPGSLQVAVLGPVGDTLSAWCTAGARHLVCHREDRPGRMQLWRTG